MMAKAKRSDKNSINVLFTSVGRRVELLRAFRRAYADLQLEGSVVAVDIDPLAPALQEADHYYIVPRITATTYIATLAEICHKEQIDLIFPLIDPEVTILAAHRGELESAGARVVVVSHQAATTTADKWLTYQFFRELNIPTPHSWIPQELSRSQPEFPLFIKPRFGSAGADSFKVHNERELAFFLEYVPDPIVQEYLEGPEITNDIVCDFEGHVLAVVSRQRIEVRWGEVAKGKTVYDPVVTQHCVRVATALNAIGPITVQCMLRDKTPCFTEINSRFAGGVPLAVAAGIPVPRWYMALAAGRHFETPPLGSYDTGLYLTRFDDSFFITQQDYAQVESHRL